MALQDTDPLAQAFADQPGGVPLETLFGIEKQNEDLLERERPDPPEPRKQLVEQWSSKIKRAKKYWQPIYDRMKADQDFAAGYQWSKEEKDDRYVANLTLRIIAQRVAFFYAKNPKFDVRRRARILNTVWDGDQATLMALQQAAAQVSQQVAMGVMDPMARSKRSKRRCRSFRTPPGSSRRKSNSARLEKRLNFCSEPTSNRRRTTSKQ
jgi:hypothetical protein